MLKHILKRLGIAVFILLAFSMILYAIMRAQPADFIELTIPQDGEFPPEFFDALREALGLNYGIVRGYFAWLGQVLRGNLGYSFSQQSRPVTELISNYMGLSFLIGLIALILQMAIAIPLGIHAAVKQYSKFDYITTIFVVMGISLPSFFFAGLLIRVFSVQFGWFPAAGGLPGEVMAPGTPGIVRFFNNAWGLVLPITTMVVLGIGGTMRYMRTNTLEVLRSDFIRTARAKGLGEGAVIYKHAFKNTVVPLATIMAGILPGLFAGSLIIEQLFMLPGVGFMAYRALNAGDLPLVMGYNLFIATLAVLGIILSDIMYVIVDPRVKMN